MDKKIIWAIIMAGGIIGGAIIFTSGNPATNNAANAVTGESISNINIDATGNQIIEISAKGGYSPRETLAKAGVPTVIKIRTNNTFDCSSIIRIPSMNYQTALPTTGETSINIPPQQKGTVLNAFCGMGMYRFEIRFD
ncbi:MAG: cupredoxin domain-containing protein [Candidatus Wolfebacteria bacterium]|nr:cupredoxin domain-containing protein [Candidatus Wolfebacteria bacterium]